MSEGMTEIERFAYVFLSHAVREAENVRVYSQDNLPVNFQTQVIAGTDVLFVQHQKDKKVYFLNSKKLVENIIF